MFGSTLGFIISAARKDKFYTDLGSWYGGAKQIFYAGCPLSGRGHYHVTKILILHPVLISGTVNGRPFKFYTELRREKYIQKFANSGVVEFRVVLTSVTNSRDIVGLSFWPVLAYCSMRHWTDSVFARTLSCI